MCPKSHPSVARLRVRLHRGVCENLRSVSNLPLKKKKETEKKRIFVASGKCKMARIWGNATKLAHCTKKGTALKCTNRSMQFGAQVMCFGSHARSLHGSTWHVSVLLLPKRSHTHTQTHPSSLFTRHHSTLASKRRCDITA